jgi:hypothetical protein
LELTDGSLALGTVDPVVPVDPEVPVGPVVPVVEPVEPVEPTGALAPPLAALADAAAPVPSAQSRTTTKNSV